MAAPNRYSGPMTTLILLLIAVLAGGPRRGMSDLGDRDDISRDERLPERDELRDLTRHFPSMSSTIPTRATVSPSPSATAPRELTSHFAAQMSYQRPASASGRPQLAKTRIHTIEAK